MNKFRFPFEFILAAAIIAANIYAVFVPANSLMNWYTTDDAFYYFKTAQNFTQGLGFSFDGISLSSGFHPLWMMVCVPVFALARFDLILPLRIIVFISILLAAGSGIYFYRLLNNWISKPAAMLLSLFWAFEPRVQATVTQLGLEAGINAFFIILLLYLTYRYESELGADRDQPRRLFWVGVAATLVILSRLDNVFIVAMIGIWLILRRPALRSMVIIDPILISISVFVSYLLRVGFQAKYQPYVESATMMVVCALVIKMLVFYAAGLYGRNKTGTLRLDLLRIIGAVSLGSLLTGIIMILSSALKLFGSFPRTVIISDWILSLLSILIFRWVLAYSGKWTGLLPVFPGEGVLRQNWKHWLQLGLGYFSPIAVTMILYMGVYKLYFGTFSPVSGQVKQWWGSIITVYGRPPATLLEFFGFSDRFDHSPWSLALVFVADAAKSTLTALNLNPKDITLNLNASMGYSLFFGGIILAVVFLNWKKFSQMTGKFPLMPLFAGCMAQIIYYSGTNYVNTRGWYWVGEMILIVILFALLVDIVINLLFDRLHINPRVVHTIVILLGMVMIVHYDSLLLKQISPTVSPQKAENYLKGITDLEKATEPGAIIGSTGGGVIAYFVHDRTIVNMDGLMNSNEYFQLMKSHDASQYFNRIKLSYVYANAVVINLSEPYVWLIKDQLTPIGVYGGSTLFRYTPKPLK